MESKEQILALIKSDGTPIECECFLVKYLFDFNCAPHVVDGRTVFELGRNDVGLPVVVDPSSGHVSFVCKGKLRFSNSSFSQLLRAFAFVREWPVPDDLPDAHRAKIFEKRMLDIDENSFQDPDAGWSDIRDEIKYGVV